MGGRLIHGIGLYTGKYGSEGDVIKTQTVAQHRIHIERAIGKVRRFRIFSSEIPVTMFGLINQIWTVCCILSNFIEPILD